MPLDANKTKRLIKRIQIFLFQFISPPVSPALLLRWGSISQSATKLSWPWSSLLNPLQIARMKCENPTPLQKTEGGKKTKKTGASIFTPHEAAVLIYLDLRWNFEAFWRFLLTHILVNKMQKKKTPRLSRTWCLSAFLSLFRFMPLALPRPGAGEKKKKSDHFPWQEEHVRTSRTTGSLYSLQSPSPRFYLLNMMTWHDDNFN